MEIDTLECVVEQASYLRAPFSWRHILQLGVSLSWSCWSRYPSATPAPPQLSEWSQRPPSLLHHDGVRKEGQTRISPQLQDSGDWGPSASASAFGTNSVIHRIAKLRGTCVRRLRKASAKLLFTPGHPVTPSATMAPSDEIPSKMRAAYIAQVSEIDKHDT